MFEKKYKADNERIEPTRESLLSLSYKMKREQAKKKDKKKAVRWIRPAAAVAAALVVLLGCFQIFRSLTPRDGQIPMAGAGAAGEAEVSQQQAQSPEDYSLSLIHILLSGRACCDYSHYRVYRRSLLSVVGDLL